LKIAIYLLPLCLLAGCQQDDAEKKKAASSETPVTPATSQSGLEFVEGKGELPPIPAELQLMQIQVALDRLGFSPGVMDGKTGQSLTLAIKGFQKANGLDETGELDTATKAALTRSPMVAATRLVQIPAAFAAGPFVPDLPKDAAEQAKLAALGYRDLMEALAERFHTTPETLIALNSPETPVGAGRTIVVPNIAEVAAPTIENDERGWGKTLELLGVASDQPAIEKIIVDKSEGWLRAMSADNKIIAQFPVTTGSSRDPLPIGGWTVKGVARNPEFHFNPKLFWDVNDSKDKQLLQPGPNSPVGVVWIDLSKAHYGIHGTGEPSTIGRAESHGCVRLANWDAARLAGMVKPGTKVLFQK
jgi:lipoprotein-anchoring transpeptidase ErfK/SrfK